MQARLGDNRIDGKGRLDQRLDGQLDIALGRLGQLWPGLFGGLTGKLVVAGSADAPQGNWISRASVSACVTSACAS